jgi:NADPH:quinone reductase-like Zn-dependent oxidoreductase
MKVVGVTGPDFMPHLIDIDEPTVPPDGVVVDVVAASVNDFDRGAVHGRYPDLTNPVFLGRDFVGRVVAVGNDVDYINVGMFVAGVAASQSLEHPGTFSERVAVRADSIAPVPDGVDPVQAAGVGLAGITAMSAVDALGAADLGNLLIYGPVSGAGGFALQIAKARGAVVAVVTPRAEAELARELGADVVIPEDGSPILAIQKARYGLDGQVDTALHVAGDPALVAGVVRPGGKFTSVTGAATKVARSDIEYRPTVVAPSGHKLADLLFKVASRRLRSRVRRVVAFDEVTDAVDLFTPDTCGRIVLVCK